MLPVSSTVTIDGTTYEARVNDDPDCPVSLRVVAPSDRPAPAASTARATDRFTAMLDLEVEDAAAILAMEDPDAYLVTWSNPWGPSAAHFERGDLYELELGFDPFLAAIPADALEELATQAGEILAEERSGFGYDERTLTWAQRIAGEWRRRSRRHQAIRARMAAMAAATFEDDGAPF